MTMTTAARALVAAALLVLPVIDGLASPYATLRAATVVDPRDGSVASPLDGLGPRSLCVVLPQLGDFCTAEYAEHLVAVAPDLRAAGLDLRVVGIGDARAARRFCAFSGLPLETLRVSPDASLHAALGLHAGPGWPAPGFLPAAARASARAWLNYMAMCAGVAAPGTLREIARGYFGDRRAPERLAPDAQVRAGPITITGTRRVQIGGWIDYENAWKDERGFQRPVELATVRLRNMVEVLSRWDEYVPDDAHLAVRGATFVFEDGEAAYEYRERGVLTYSATMPRPLSFLEPYIGAAKARNPLGFADTGGEAPPASAS